MILFLMSFSRNQVSYTVKSEHQELCMPLETLPCQLGVWRRAMCESVSSVFYGPPPVCQCLCQGSRPGFPWVLELDTGCVSPLVRFGMLFLFLLHFLTGVQRLLQSLALRGLLSYTLGHVPSLSFANSCPLCSAIPSL